MKVCFRGIVEDTRRGHLGLGLGKVNGGDVMKRFLICVALAAPFAVGCGGGQPQGPVTPGGPVVEYPEWVMKGSGAFGGESRVFYGVGSASGIRNHSLARTTADNRARAEISKVFETYSASLMKDFQEHVSQGDQSQESQMVTNAVKTFSARTLNGVQIVEHWIHPTDGTFYALARLDIEGFMSQLEAANQLSNKVKQMVKRSAEKAFADLEAEEAKRSDQQE